MKARLIDGTGRAPIEKSAILVENLRITRVGRRGQIKVARGTLRVDLAGKTVVPGLVLLHGHVGYIKGTTFAAENYTRDNLIDHLTRYLYYGIVAMMSTGTDPGDLPYQLRAKAHAGCSGRPAAGLPRRMIDRQPRDARRRVWRDDGGRSAAGRS